MWCLCGYIDGGAGVSWWCLITPTIICNSRGTLSANSFSFCTDTSTGIYLVAIAPNVSLFSLARCRTYRLPFLASISIDQAAMPRVQTGMVAPRYKSRHFPRTHAVVRVSFQVVKTHNRSPLFDSLPQFYFPATRTIQIIRDVLNKKQSVDFELHCFICVSLVKNYCLACDVELHTSWHKTRMHKYIFTPY